MPAGYHPVILEMGRQTDCVWKYFPWLPTTFNEFKVEIPYVQHQDYQAPLMFKPCIYEDSTLDRFGSEEVYGLPTFPANFELTDTSYSLVPTDMPTASTFNAVFESDEPFSSDPSAFPFFSEWIDTNAYPWLCKDFFGSTKCALDYYGWSSMQIRPAKANITFSDGFIPGLPALEWTLPSILQPLGTVQLIVQLNITSPDDCPPAQ